MTDGNENPDIDDGEWRPWIEFVFEDSAGIVEEVVPSKTHFGRREVVRVSIKPSDPLLPAAPKFTRFIRQFFASASSGVYDVCARVGGLDANQIVLSSHALDRLHASELDVDFLGDTITLCVPGARQEKLVYYDIKARRKTADRPQSKDGKQSLADYAALTGRELAYLEALTRAGSHGRPSSAAFYFQMSRGRVKNGHAHILKPTEVRQLIETGEKFKERPESGHTEETVRGHVDRFEQDGFPVTGTSRIDLDVLEN